MVLGLIPLPDNLTFKFYMVTAVFCNECAKLQLQLYAQLSGINSIENWGMYIHMFVLTLQIICE